MIKAILAVDDSGAIGNKGHLPWSNISLDLQNFKKLTIGNHVVMGRKTWESLPEKYRPLPKRINWVVSNTLFDDVANIAIKDIKSLDNIAWIIGGAQIIEQTIDLIEEFRVTRVKGCHTADTHIDIDNLLKDFTKISRYTPVTGNQPAASFEIWTRNLPR